MKKFLFLMLLYISNLMAIGCASMSDRSRHQYVYIESSPPGARIMDKKEEIGTTPGLVRVRRKKAYTLELEKDGVHQKLNLEAKYRWNEGFWSNLALLTYAPVGVLVDYLGGAAWNYNDPPTIQLGKASKTNDAPSSVVAIAPTLASTDILSEDTMQFWDQKLPELLPRSKVLSSQHSISLFAIAGYTYDGAPDEIQNRREILANIGATSLFISKLDESEKGLFTSGYLINAKNEKTELSAAPFSLLKDFSSEDSWHFRYYKWLQLIPNTVGFEFSNSRVTLTTRQQQGQQLQYTSADAAPRSDWEKSFSYLDSLSLSRIEMGGFKEKGRWMFKFTPSVQISNKNIFFPNFSSLAGVEFNVAHIGTGLGPEIGWKAGRHYGYLKFIPIISWYRIEWDQPGGSQESVTSFPVNYQEELGYIYSYTEHLSLKFYARSLSAPADNWNKVTQKINPSTPVLDSPTENKTGFAFQYTFDTRYRVAR